MANAPFLRPMAAGFAVTATAIFVMPMSVRAQTAPVASHCGAPAPAPKPRGLKLGRLFSAAQNSGVMPFLGGRSVGAALAASLATTAIDAASQSHAEADRPAAITTCAASEQ